MPGSKITMQKAEKAPKQSKRKWQLSLGQLILLALLLGVATGLFLGEIVAPLEQVGIAFIRMLQITVKPLRILRIEAEKPVKNSIKRIASSYKSHKCCKENGSTNTNIFVLFSF